MTPAPPETAEMVFDWNAPAVPDATPPPQIMLLDETLRDGLQSPSVTDPPGQLKKQLLRLMCELGIHAADLGLPGAGPRAVRHVTALCETIRDESLPIDPSCAARTLAADIQPIIDISKDTGVSLEILTFLGASPIRALAEGWDLTQMARLAGEAVAMGVSSGLPVAFVTEDTVRAHPSVLKLLFETAIGEGAQRLILCDTVGAANPAGIRRLVSWTLELLDKLNAPHITLDFHGHNDRGLALSNSIAAIEAGCSRIHGTALGIGERIGNTAMDQLLVNLSLEGHWDGDLGGLMRYCRLASQATGRAIPVNYPVAGADAFRTATGVHAAAIVKAQRVGDTRMANRIYSGVPADLVGRHQEIEVGYMSGESNVLAWLNSHGYAANPALVAEIFRVAKTSDHTLERAEIQAIVARVLDEPAANGPRLDLR